MAKRQRAVTKQQEAVARRIVQRAMNQQQAREVAEKRKLIGRFYKYQNRYSSGDPWWLYAVVVAVDDHGRLTTTQIQHDTNGGVSLTGDVYGGLLPSGGWVEIPRDEFLHACAEIGLAFLQRLAEAQSVVAVDPHVGRRES